ncbi:MAG TPA: M14 family murein peptide amidase A [Candidatus Gastranaerophilales bacterium]|nr:M14 family murein peptide amidase A [Candidatus Gastranaerophilales bacterium]
MIIKQEKEILSPKNNKIQLFKTESSFAEPHSTVLFIGVFHGDEPDGEFLINNLITDIEKNPDLTGNNRILFIPCLNPDGKQEKTRENSNGVDLNRNFPTKNRIESDEKNEFYPGKTAASEIETRFIMEIVDEYKPDRILTIHSPYKIINYDGPADEISEKMSKLNGYPVQVDIGYPTPGSFGTYAGKERKIPVITLELPENSDPEDLWVENKKALYYFLNTNLNMAGNS